MMQIEDLFDYYLACVEIDRTLMIDGRVAPIIGRNRADPAYMAGKLLDDFGPWAMDKVRQNIEEKFTEPGWGVVFEWFDDHPRRFDAIAKTRYDEQYPTVHRGGQKRKERGSL